MTDINTQRELDAMPANREQQYAELFAAYDRAYSADGSSGSDDETEAEQAIDDSILAIEQTRGFEVTISTGGPGEWLECVIDTHDNTVIKVDFVCAWWSTPQRTAIREGSALWRLAERMNPAQYE